MGVRKKSGRETYGFEDVNVLLFPTKIKKKNLYSKEDTKGTKTIELFTFCK